MSTNQETGISDMDLLRAIDTVGDPIASTPDIVDHLSADQTQVLERLKGLSRNGLVAARTVQDDQGWLIKMPGRITLEREG
jgi:DNA-binding MarR family transcriptional regulator